MACADERGEEQREEDEREVVVAQESPHGYTCMRPITVKSAIPEAIRQRQRTNISRIRQSFSRQSYSSELPLRTQPAAEMRQPLFVWSRNAPPRPATSTSAEVM